MDCENHCRWWRIFSIQHVLFN